MNDPKNIDRRKFLRHSASVIAFGAAALASAICEGYRAEPLR